MSHLGYLIQDAWEKLLALPMEFWLVSPIVTLGFALVGCVFWSLPGLFGPMVFNKKLLFKHLPILWTAFQFVAISIETKAEVFLFVGGIIFALFALIVQFKDEIPPR